MPRAFDPAKVDAPRRGDAGARMWCCPSYIAATPQNQIAGGCGGCVNRTAHNVTVDILVEVPLGTDRYAMIPIEQRQDAEGFHRAGANLFLRSIVEWGYIGNEVVYNAGEAGDNASQFWVFEVVGGGVGYLSVKGRNPKALSTQGSRLNPEWPLPDPVTGTLGRLVWTSVVGVMVPCAAMVEFLAPSVLAGNATPIVTAVTCESVSPDDVTFTLVFGDGFDASNARVPFDDAYPPADGKYFCSVRMEFLAPQLYKDYQAPVETQFARRSVTLNGPGVHELKDSEGGSTRILFPSMAAGCFTAAFVPVLEGVALESRLSTVQSGGGYVTTLDLSDLDFDKVLVSYWAEATASDAFRVPVMGQCVHSKLDPTASYVHADGPQHCGNTDASGFQNDLYHQACWLPGRCDGFALLDESITTMGDASLLASLWTRAGWVLEQQREGYSAAWNFRLYNRGGASVEALAGSFCDQVPGGRFPRRYEFHGRRMGKRVVYTTTEGDTHHQLAFGAFWLSPYNFGNGAAVYAPDAADFDTLQIGIVAELVSGWVDGKAELLRGNPWRYAGTTNVYDFQGGGGSLAKVNTACDSEAYVVAVDVNEVADGSLVARMQGIYE